MSEKAKVLMPSEITGEEYPEKVERRVFQAGGQKYVKFKGGLYTVAQVRSEYIATGRITR